MIRTIVEDNLTVVQMNIEDEEIPSLLDSGFVSAVLRQTDDGIIEYADVDWETYTFAWTEPHLKTFD
jgi:hypothetical protein